MSKVTGPVYKVTEKQWGSKTLYSIKIDGNDTYYRTGDKRPACNSGDVVEFDFVVGNNGQSTAVLDTLKVVGTAQQSNPKAGPASSTKGGGEDWGARAAYWAEKDQRDLDAVPEYRYRSAANQAQDFLAFLGSVNALPLNKSEEGDTPAAKKKRFDALVALRGELTAMFYEEFLGMNGQVDEEVETPAAEMEDFTPNDAAD